MRYSGDFSDRVAAGVLGASVSSLSGPLGKIHKRNVKKKAESSFFTLCGNF
jgi:hypothetical protein